MATTISTGTNPYKLGSPPDFGTLYSGRALDFDGVTDYVNMSSGLLSLAGNATGSVVADTWTISIWAKVNSLPSSSSEGLIGWLSGDYHNYGTGIKIDSTGKVFAIQAVNNTAFYDDRWTSAISTGRWYHLVATSSGVGGGETVKLYVDGVERQSTTDTTANHSYNFFIGATYNSYADCTLSNVQIWDAVWSLSDVQYAYTHPEKLITDNSAVTSGTTISNLKAWYPMTEGNPRSPQTTVYDGANLGLGTTPLSNSDFSSDSFTGWTLGGPPAASEVISHDGHETAAHITTSSSNNGPYQTVLTSGQLYKVSFDVKVISGDVYLGKSDNKVGGGNFTDSSWTSYTYYWTAGDTTFRVYNATASSEFYIDNISVKPVNAKNHGTTKFYGEELVSNGDFSGTDLTTFIANNCCTSTKKHSTSLR